MRMFTRVRAVSIGIALSAASSARAAEDASPRFEALRSRYTAARSYTGTFDVKAYYGGGLLEQVHYFMAFEKPNRYFVQKSTRSTGRLHGKPIAPWTSSYASDGQDLYSTLSWAPLQYSRRKAEPDLSYLLPGLRAGPYQLGGLPVLLSEASQSLRPCATNQPKTPVLIRGRVATPFVFCRNSEDGTPSQSIFYVSDDNILLRCETTGFSKGETKGFSKGRVWRVVEEHTQVEINPQIPASFFVAYSAPGATVVSAFSNQP